MLLFLRQSLSKLLTLAPPFSLWYRLALNLYPALICPSAWIIGPHHQIQWRHSKVKASLCYVRPCVKNKHKILWTLVLAGLISNPHSVVHLEHIVLYICLMRLRLLIHRVRLQLCPCGAHQAPNTGHSSRDYF